MLKTFYCSEELRILKIEIEKIVEKIENNTSAGISEMPNLLKKNTNFSARLVLFHRTDKNRRKTGNIKGFDRYYKWC